MLLILREVHRSRLRCSDITFCILNNLLFRSSTIIRQAPYCSCGQILPSVSLSLLQSVHVTILPSANPLFCLSVLSSLCLSYVDRSIVRLTVRPSPGRPSSPYVCTSIRPSVRPSVRPYVRTSACQAVHPVRIRLSTRPSVRTCPPARPTIKSVIRSIRQSISPSIHLVVRIRPTVRALARLSVCMSFRPSVSLYDRLSKHIRLFHDFCRK